MEQVVLVSSSILSIVSKILDFKDDWVTVPDDFQHQLDILESRLHNYQEEVRIHGEPEDSCVMKILKNVEDTLKGAEARVSRLDKFSGSEQCCSHIRLWYAKLSIILFPENIGKILKKVNEDIDNIPKVRKEEAAASALLRDNAKRRPISTATRDQDRFYVPIEKAQSAVIAAMTHLTDHWVVLLQGGVDRGKTSLARYFLPEYYESKEVVVSGDEKHRNPFEHVIWVSCENCSSKDVPEKQLKILQEYFPDSLGDSPTVEKTGSKQTADALQRFLRGKKVLIILDDISDDGFLYEMWNAVYPSGPDVRCLLTSRRSDICNISNSDSWVAIQMQDPTEEEAMKILASHVGLKLIPDNVKVFFQTQLNSSRVLLSDYKCTR